MQTKIATFWQKTRKFINRNEESLIISAAILILAGLIGYIGLPFMGIPSINGVRIKYKVDDHILKNCQKDIEKYDWLDCSKLEVEWAYSNDGELQNYCSDSWFVGGQVRNDNWDILWSNTIETDFHGNIRSEEYGSSIHPDNWDEPMQDPNKLDFKVDTYMTHSPCSPVPEDLFEQNGPR